MRAALILTVAVLVVLDPASGSNCPQDCDCVPNDDHVLQTGQQTLTVDCSGRDLLEIPYPLPNGTTHLDASNNIIQYVRVVDFSPGDTALRFLQLQNNDLIDIQSGAFRRLTSLETLNLDNNNRLGVTRDLREGVFQGLHRLLSLSAINTGLKRLPEGIFEPLRDLVQIDLRFNQLEEITTGTFSDLQNLQRISLDSNFISNLQTQSFTNLPGLVHLDLADNQLRAVTERAFTKLPRIRSIDLTDNPVECACDAVYLHNFFTRKRLSSPVCAEPEALLGANLLDLNPEEICVFPTAMIVPDETVVILNGTVLELSCVTSGTPPPQVTWSRDGMLLQADGTEVIITEDNLVITNSSVLNSGQYHCTATSSAGLVSSAVQVLVLSEEQRLTEAVVRADVLLECSSGVPAGVAVQWSFNDSTLAPVSSKYVVLRNGSLLVQDVWVEDMGEYTCQLGDIQLRNTLTLTAVPEIISINQGPCEQPSLVTVNSNTTTLLICEVFALPLPTVQWFFTRPNMPTQQLQTQQQPGATVGSVRGVVSLVMPSDLTEGNYSCVGSNALGEVSQEITVIVRRIAQLGMPAFLPVSLVEGDTLILECQLPEEILAGNASIVWLTDFGMPVDTSRVDLTCDLNQTLVISDFDIQDDLFDYACEVEGMPFNTLAFFFLTVSVSPSILTDCDVPTVVARVGDNVTLSCVARGNPGVMWEWFRGEEVLTTSGRVSLLDGGERVSIVRAQLVDSDVYNCTVSNVINDEVFIESYAQRLDVQSPPFFTYRPQSITVLSGEMGVLFCGGGGNPTPTVTWQRLLPGWVVEEVIIDGRIQIADNFLLFTDVRLSDEGTYFCTLTSALGNRTSSKTLLNVYMFPEISAPQTEVVFELGAEGGLLQCSGTGDPIPDVQWLRLPDMSILPSPGFPNYVSDGSNLVIKEVGLEDAGVFRCWVANAAGQVSQDITVSVIAPPSPSVQPAEVLANVGCQLTLNCLDAGQPPLDLQWSFNEEPVSVLSERGVQAVVRPNGDLQLNNLQLQHSGNYSCTVFGAFRNRSAVSVVTVRDPLFPEQGPATPPSVTSPTPSSQLLSAGQVAQFVCLTQGVPRPQVEWLKDGEEVMGEGEEGRVEILAGRVLVVRNVSTADDGVYSCVASNSLGNTSQEFDLAVAVPAMIIEPPLPERLPIYSNFTLRCVAAGSPAPLIIWLLNDVVVEAGGRHFIDPAAGTLEVRDTSVAEDSGHYTCLAWNEVGSDQHTVLVQITIPLSVWYRPESQVLDSGSSLLLDCVVHGSPPPSISWAKDNQSLPICDNTLPQGTLCVHSDSYIYVPSAREQDSGVYTCTAEGDDEVLTLLADITVLPARRAPEISLAPSSEFVVNGSRFLLDCVASGAPPPDVRWLLNMEPLNVTELESFEQLDNDSLLVLEAGEGTVGFFTCVADNGVGRCEVTVLVVLVEEFSAAENVTSGRSSSPVLTSQPLGTLTLFPGQSSTLDCTASGEPPPTITWTRNGMAIPLVSLPSLSVADNGSLVLSAVTGAEEGNYSCVASNIGGVYKVHFELNIAGGSGVTGSSERTVLTESPVELVCPGGGQQHRTVMWLHAGEVVHESETVRVLGNGSLLLPTPHIQHAGHYMCLTPSTRGWTDFSLHLHVTPREEPPYFTVRPEDVHVVKKGFVLLACSAVSSTGEPTHVQWTQAHVNMSRTGPRHLVLQDNSLLLSNVRVQEAGEYSCVASNSYGQSVVSATVTVSRLKVDQFVFSEEGSNVVLTCPLEGPQERVWLRDDHTPLTANNGKVWLHDVDHTHQGDYTCYRGKTGLNYFLIVQAAPQITTPPSVVTVLPGETATLHCVAVGRPHPLVQWSHGDVLLSERGVGHSVLVNGSLVLYAVEGGRDDGVYVCQAHNTAGLDQLNSTIIIN